MNKWVIKVRLADGSVTLGRPSGSAVPYSYITREQAVTAAQLWGDAYTRGDVWVDQEVPSFAEAKRRLDAGQVLYAAVSTHDHTGLGVTKGEVSSLFVSAMGRECVQLSCMALSVPYQAVIAIGDNWRDVYLHDQVRGQ